MKRSLHLLVGLVVVGCSLEAIAGCPCARQKKHMRAKAASTEVPMPLLRQGSEGQAIAPVTSAAESAKATATEAAQGKVVEAATTVLKAVPEAVTTVVTPAQPAPTLAPKAQPIADNRIDLVNQADFDAHVTKHTNAIGVFTTTWCGPCKNLKPILDELRNENKDVMFVYVDGDEFPGLASKHVKQGFPTLKFFKNGKEVGQAIGGQSKAELQSLISQHYKGAPATVVMVEPTPQPAPQPKVEKVAAKAEAPLLRQGFEGQALQANATTTGNKIVLASQGDFDGHISKNKNAIGVFTTTWCGPCKQLKPVLEDLIVANKHVTFVYVDGDKFPGLVNKYSKVGFPTLKFFKNGKVVGETIGGRQKDELQSMINQHFKG